MKATIKLGNSNSIENFNSIKELKNYLNHCLYYSDEVYLVVPSNYDPIKYSETNDIASLIRDVRFYGYEYLEVIPTYE